YQPDDVIRGRDQELGNSFATHPDRHGTRRQVEPGNGMQHHKEEADYAKCDRKWRLHPMFKSRIRLRSMPQGSQLKERDHYKGGHKYAAQFAQDELQILPLSQPPVHGNARPVPAWMEFRIDGYHLRSSWFRRLRCWLGCRH